MYPFNPNGSEMGKTGFTSDDGRATILMPHPERLIYWNQFSWHPTVSSDEIYSPWFQIFTNAHNWVINQ